MERLCESKIRTSLFIDPDEDIVRISAELGVDAIELHTGEYANTWKMENNDDELARLKDTAELARSLGLAVHAGHGLTYENVTPVASIEAIEELNIGHSIISRAVIVGIERAVWEMGELIRNARDGVAII